MKARISWHLSTFLAFLFTLFILPGCGGGGGGSSSSSPAPAQNGNVSVALTDAPGLEYDHVWITVKDIWFHTSNAAGPQEAGWLKFPLSSPETIDLVDLTNGNMANVFSTLTLPVGNYQQIRLFLASTEDSLVVHPNPPAGQSVALKYNNEVDLQVSGSSYQAPLTIPNPTHGIALFGTFQVTAGGTLHLAIDFNADEDVVKTISGLDPEFILKPRLVYFDLDNVGAIAGAIDPSVIQSSTVTNGGFNFVIKAEELSANGTYHIVRRYTTIASDGTFILYPLPASTSGKTYDIMLRGRNVDTVIIKNVPVTKGTTPQSATSIGPAILMNYDNTEYTANFSGSVSPTGSWANFYQTLPGVNEVPYEVRVRHVNPYTGKFEDAIDLSTGPISVGTYNNGGAITLTTENPVEGLGGYKVALDAYQFARAYTTNITGQHGQQNVPIAPVSLTAQQGPNTLSGQLNVPTPNLGLDRGYILASRDGIIVDAINAGASGTGIMANGGAYSFSLPGGSGSSPLPGAFYSLHAIGWKIGSKLTTLSVVIPRIADLRTGDDTVNLDMLKVMP